MSVLNQFLRGLSVKLVFLHLLWIVPALAIADYWVLARETAALERAVAGGALTKASERIASEVLADWPDQRALELSLERQRLLLERSRGGLAPGTGHVLLELSETPLGLRLLDADGRELAQSGARASNSDELLTEESEVSVFADDGQQLRLQLLLQVPRPSFSLFYSGSFEWQVLLSAGVLLALLSSALMSLYLVGRLNGMGAALKAWRRGDLEHRIGESRRDELGRLANDLDGMAADLSQLLDDRARLGALQERQRVARDLHDTAKQKAFALGLQLATLRRGLQHSPTPSALDEAERLCAELRTELAELVDAFRNEPTPKQDFRGRLDARIRRWQMSTGLRLKLRLDPGSEPTAADAEQLLRVVDECLANVARHAQVDQAQVQLIDCGQGQWQLQVSDGGVGFEPRQQSGNGLVHLAERAACLPQGRLDVQSQPGRGTAISLHFSISEQANARQTEAAQSLSRPQNAGP